MTGLLIVARLAGERVAFASDEIESVVEIGAITPIPGAAPHVAGLAALRSRVLTVIDCRASLEPGAAVCAPRDALVAVRGGHLYALLLDGVDDVAEVEADLAPPPPGLSPDWARIVRARAVAEDALFLVLDVPALIAGSQTPRALNPTLTHSSYDDFSEGSGSGK